MAAIRLSKLCPFLKTIVGIVQCIQKSNQLGYCAKRRIAATRDAQTLQTRATARSSPINPSVSRASSRKLFGTTKRSKAGDGLVQQRLFRDGQHSDVVAAMHSAIGRSGAGTGGTRNISGNQSQHVALETSLADMHGKEVSFVFTSGWISDLATLSTLGEVLPDAVIF